MWGGAGDMCDALDRSNSLEMDALLEEMEKLEDEETAFEAKVMQHKVYIKKETSRLTEEKKSSDETMQKYNERDILSKIESLEHHREKMSYAFLRKYEDNPGSQVDHLAKRFVVELVDMAYYFISDGFDDREDAQQFWRIFREVFSVDSDGQRTLSESFIARLEDIGFRLEQIEKIKQLLRCEDSAAAEQSQDDSPNPIEHQDSSPNDNPQPSTSAQKRLTTPSTRKQPSRQCTKRKK